MSDAKMWTLDTKSGAKRFVLEGERRDPCFQNDTMPCARIVRRPPPSDDGMACGLSTSSARQKSTFGVEANSFRGCRQNAARDLILSSASRPHARHSDYLTILPTLAQSEPVRVMTVSGHEAAPLPERSRAFVAATKHHASRASLTQDDGAGKRIDISRHAESPPGNPIDTH